MNYQLSFDRGEPICYVVDKKTDSVLHTIHTRGAAEDEEPDIIAEDLFSIMDKEDIDHAARISKLKPIEKKALIKHLKSRTKPKTNQKLADAYDLVMSLLDEKLKKELDFAKDDVKLVLAIGHKSAPFDRHIFICGAAGSGKSYLTADILRHDKRQRPIMLLSKLEDDPAFKGLVKMKDDSFDPESFDLHEKESKGKKGERMKQFKISKADDLLSMPSKDALRDDKGAIIVFDDVNTFDDPDVVDFLFNYQNDMLETARKHNISIISTSHGLRRYKKTKSNIEEAEFIILFPSSNKLLSERFLKDNLGLLKNERMKILSKCAKNRYMIVKVSNPCCVIHEKGIILL